MIGAASAYLSGSFFAFFFYDVTAWLILAVAVCMLLYYGRKRGWTKTDNVLVAVMFTVGIAVYSLYTSFVYEPVTAYDGKSGSFSGEVAEISLYDNSRAGYVLKGCIDGKTKAKINYYGADISAEYGDIINIGNCTFAVPQKDYLFDSETYYKSEGIFLTIASAKDVTCEHMHSRPLRNKMAVFRENMISRLNEKSDVTTGAFLSAMLFGEKRQLDDEVKTALYRSGIGHILAVSGIHVSIIAMLLMGLLKKLNVNRFVSYALMNAVLIMFVVMANTPVSAIRATVMTDFFYAAGLFRRQNNSLNSLSAAALIICLAQPYSIMNAGFLLSVSGTFGIAVLAPFMTKKWEYSTVPQIIAKDFVSALLTAIAVLPFCVLFFDETSIISPFSNVLLVPLCTAAMINGVIFVLTGGVLPILSPAKVLVSVVTGITGEFAEIRGFHIVCGSENEKAFLILLAVACMGLYFIGHSRKAVALGISLSIAIFGIYNKAEMNAYRKRFTVAVLGKSRNAAVVVSYMGAADIVDMSGSSSSAAYVSRYLTSNGIDGIDHIVLTKNAANQYQAYLEELEYVTTDEFLIPSDVGTADHVFDESGFSIDRTAYSITWREGVLNVVFGSESVTVQPAASDDIPESGVDIRYGSPKKAETISADAIYLDNGNNNIEIVLSGKGSFERRL